MSAERILIIEDDSEIQEMLKYAFDREGWKLIQVKTGEEGLDHLSKEGADCIILDLMLPGMDGFKTLKKIRKDEKFHSLPIIICSARGEEVDVITGLELGADDYVVKPYSPRVLTARVRAGLRRRETFASGSGSLLQHGKLVLDVERHSCSLDGNALDLSATEFAILAKFMANPDIVFSRQKLITAVHGPDYPVTDRSVDVQILGLRKKLKEAIKKEGEEKEGGEMIETIRGVGYRFTSE